MATVDPLEHEGNISDDSRLLGGEHLMLHADVNQTEKPSSPVPSLTKTGLGPYYIVDFLGHGDEEYIVKGKGYWNRFKQSKLLHKFRDLLYLVLVGVVSATINMLVNFLADKLAHQRNSMLQVVDKHLNSVSYIRDYFLWITFVVVLTLAAAAAPHFITRNAIGSGIPELKTIFSGVLLYKFLSSLTLLAKVVSITLSLAAGLSVGREGPFLHISCIVANQFAQHVGLFKYLKHNSKTRSFPPQKMQMLAAACACGVSTTFGAPIGGVVFAMEVTSTYYMPSMLPKALLTAVAGAVFIRLQTAIWGKHLTEYLRYLTNLFNFSVQQFDYELWELPLFVIVGLLCGLVAIVFVKLTQRGILLRDKYFKKRPFLHCVLVALLTGLLTYPVKMFHLYEMRAIDTLADPKKLPEPFHSQDTGGIFGNLAVFFLLRFLLTIPAITLPIAAGVFAPTFAAGAALGRLLGEALRHDSLKHVFHAHVSALEPAGYSVVAAAALSGSITRSVACAVVVIELTGQSHYILPVFLATLTAYGVASLAVPSVYDVVINSRGLPVMPKLRPKFQSRHVSEIMRQDVPVITQGQVSRADCERLFDEPSALTRFPVVDEKGVFLGAISRRFLELGVARLKGPHQGTMEEESLLDHEGIDAVHDDVVISTSDMLTAELILSPTTPLQRVDYLLRMVGSEILWICKHGQYLGCVLKDDIVFANVTAQGTWTRDDFED